MQTEFKEKVFIVTGGAMGLGKGFAEAILKEGGKVTIADISEAEAKKTVKELGLRYNKDKVHFSVCNVTKPEDIQATWESTEAFFNDKVHGLVNNAGINGSQGWKLCMDINMMGVMNGTYLANEKMSRANGGNGGIIINTASVAGLTPAPMDDLAPYFVSKHGVVTLTRSFGTDKVFSRDGIRHVCICPFFTKTMIITEDPKTWELVNVKVGSDNIMDVGKVVDAFTTLVKEGHNGAAIVVMPHMAPFYIPYLAEQVLFFWMTAGSYIATKLFKVNSFGAPWMALLYFVISVVLLNFVMRMLLGIFF